MEKQPRHVSLKNCNFDCGTRARYVQGCRCKLCKKANRDYYYANTKKRIWHGGNPLVDAGPARKHLEALSKHKRGRHLVSEVSGVAVSTLTEIRTGQQAQCRKETAEAILAVPLSTPVRDGERVDAGPTWRLLNDLLGRGWTKSYLATRLGSTAKTPALQVRKDRVNASTARKVKELHEELSQRLDPNTEAAKIVAMEAT
jgi:hypothetical protein